MSKYLEYFEGAFDASVTEKVKLENKPYVAYSKTEGVVYTIIPKEEKDMWIISTVELKDISNCTYNMVDLGLPSGLKWADRNVGASSPEHCGSYFQWGDTNAYTYIESSEITTEQLVNILNPLIGPGITVDNVKDILASQGVTSNDLRDAMKATGMDAVSINKEFNWNSYFDTTDGGSTFNKYNNEGGLTVLELSDDAASTHMGSNYRMPTIEEIEEFILNTTWVFIDVDGNEYSRGQAEDGAIELGKLKGVRFTGSNGNSIFIPAAGCCVNSMLVTIKSGCLLWSSSLFNSYKASIWIFSNQGYINDSYDSRYYGYSVRGVQA